MVRRIKAPFDEPYDFIISKLCFVLSNPTSYVKQSTNYQQPMWKKDSHSQKIRRWVID